MPSCARLIFEASTAGAAVTCGRRELNCSHRCPRAERMSASERSTPRFCFKPRSIASRSDSCTTPGTGFAGTLPANGLTPCVPGIGWPGVLGGEVVPDCANEGTAPKRKTAARRKVLQDPGLSFKTASLGGPRIWLTALPREKYPSLVGYSGQGIPDPTSWMDLKARRTQSFLFERNVPRSLRG